MVLMNLFARHRGTGIENRPVHTVREGERQTERAAWKDIHHI